MCKYASFLTLCNRVDLAEDYFKRAYQCESHSLNFLQEYAEFLAKYKTDLSLSDQLFLKSIEMAPEMGVLYHNYGLYLAKYRR